MNREDCERIVDAYGEAWETKDADAIVKIFTEDARYIERPQGKGPVKSSAVYYGHEGIRQYWENHIVRRERNIQFTAIHEDLLWDPVKQTCLAKWEATFEVLQLDTKLYKPVHFVQVAILEMDPATKQIKRLEEYWHSLHVRQEISDLTKGVIIKQNLKPPPRKQPIQELVAFAHKFHACISAALRELPRLKRHIGFNPSRYHPLIWTRTKNWQEWYAEVLPRAEISIPHIRISGAKDVLGTTKKIKFMDVMLPQGNSIWIRACNEIQQQFSDHHELNVPRQCWTEGVISPRLISSISPEVRVMQVMRHLALSYKDLPKAFVVRASQQTHLMHHMPMFAGKELLVLEGYKASATQQQAEDAATEVLAKLQSTLRSTLGITVHARPQEDDECASYLCLCADFCIDNTSRTRSASSDLNVNGCPPSSSPVCSTAPSDDSLKGIGVKKECEGKEDKSETEEEDVGADAKTREGKKEKDIIELPIGSLMVVKSVLKYERAKGKQGRDHMWMTNWTISSGIVGASVLKHGNDDGVVWPARVAPVQVAVVPFVPREREELGPEKQKLAEAVYKTLCDLGIRCVLDAKRLDLAPNDKIRRYRMQGVPVIVSVGSVELFHDTLRLLLRTPARPGGELDIQIPFDHTYGPYIRKLLDELDDTLIGAAAAAVAPSL